MPTEESGNLECGQGLGRSSVTHSFSAYPLGFYYVTRCVLHVGNTVINPQRPFPYEAYTLLGSAQRAVDSSPR